MNSLIVGGVGVLAVDTVARAASPTIAAPTTIPSARPETGTDRQAPGAEVEKLLGFRSARFGMSEADVRGAIAKDFSIEANAIKTSNNPYERTHVLTLRAPDVLPGGGAAEIAYIFGYKSKKLVQVSLLWSKTTDKSMTAERLVENGNVLRNHFVEAGYKQATVVTNAALKSGLLLFRGEDNDGHSTVLILQGTMSAGDKGKETLTPLGLTLYYLADAKHPDIFKLTRGQF